LLNQVLLLLLHRHLYCPYQVYRFLYLGVLLFLLLHSLYFVQMNLDVLQLHLHQLL
jgi:hypothetical protein